MGFTNLIRFKDEVGRIRYGNIAEERLHQIIGSTVTILNGDPFEGEMYPTGETAVIHEVMAPVDNVPLVLCIGLNYAEHAKEASVFIPISSVICCNDMTSLQLPIPPNPVLFVKPSDAVAGPFDDIEIPRHAHFLDYEVQLHFLENIIVTEYGELCLIIKKTGKNIPEDEADDYILGYTAGNDISSRYWQRPPHSGGQYCYAKGFDKFAPLGPTIRATSKTDTRNLRMETLVNGEQRQSTSTGDMLFTPRQIVSHLSKGCTLRKGTVIMTGTPDGIAGRMPNEPWLQKNDIIRVSISGIGSIENKIVVS